MQKKNKRYTVWYTLVIVTILSVFNGCTKDDFSESQATTFIKYLKSGNHDKGIKVLQKDDGGYAVLANVFTSDSANQVCFMETDKFGNTVQPPKYYGNVFDDFGYGFVENEEGGYYIAGSTMNSQNVSNILLIKIDSLGRQEWKRDYGGAENEEAFDVVLNDAGEIIIAGYEYIETSKKQVLIAKYNSDGEPVWSQLGGYEEDEEGRSIVYDGINYYVAGSTKSQPRGTTGTNFFISKWSEDGTASGVKWVTFNGDSEAKSIVLHGNNLLVAGEASDTATGIRSIALIEIEKTQLSVLWEETYSLLTDNSCEQIGTRDNSIYLVGNTGEKAASESKSMIILTNSKGGAPEYYYYGEGVFFEPAGFCFTFDGGMTLTGRNKTGDNSAVYLMKLNNQLQLR